MKGKARTCLMALPRADATLWPLAVQHASWCHRQQALARGFKCPPFGATVTARIKNPPGAFAPRARDMIFLGECREVSGGFLLGSKRAGKWTLQVSSSFVEQGVVVEDDPAAGAEEPAAAADAAPEEPEPAAAPGDDPAAAPGEDAFADEDPRDINCPACNGEHRAHTRDEHCRLGPPAEGGGDFPPVPEEEAEEAGFHYSCPACRGRKRPHTRDHRCRLGPHAAMLRVDDPEDAPLQYHDVVKNSGMQVLSCKDVNASYGQEREEWKLALERELASLREHGVYEVLHPEETRAVHRSAVLPMLAIPGIKAADEAGYRRKKVRAVVCGNFQAVGEGEQLFTNNVDISSVRVALAIAAECSWVAAVLDVITAFLNAPLPPETPEVVMRPPPIFVKFGLVEEGELWRAVMAIYGLRVAPRAWGTERDDNFRAMVIDIEDVPHQLRQSAVDPAVWAVIELKADIIEAHVRAAGYLLVYVDDLLTVGPASVVTGVEAALLGTWKCTVNPHISCKQPGSLHYLGLTFVARHDGFLLHQVDYVQELLAKWGMAEARGCLSIDAEPEAEEQEVEDLSSSEPALADVRLAQRMGGGLIWASSRTRPDIAYAVSRLSSAAAKRPVWAMQLGKRTLRYLAAARDYGLFYKAGSELASAITGYDDASFGVGSSQTGVVIFFRDMLVDWRSCRQSVDARSTAEAEVTALAMGHVMLEGVEAVLDSMSKPSGIPTLYGDNSASICLARRRGSWRTRALAIKAVGLRSRLDLATFVLEFVPTKDQRADGLTKFLSVQLLAAACRQLGLIRVEPTR